MKKLSIVLWFLLLGGMMMPLWGQAQEKLGRGVVAVKSSDGVFLSWRSLATDTRKLGFDIYRDGVKITAAPVVTTTNYVDKDGTVDSRYVLKGILDGTTTETTKEVTVWAEQFKKIPLKRPEGGVTLPYDVVQTDKDKTRETYPDGQEYTYTPNDCSVGDVDGDGGKEIIVKGDIREMYIWTVINWTVLLCGELISERTSAPVPTILSLWYTIWTVTARPKLLVRRHREQSMVRANL